MFGRLTRAAHLLRGARPARRLPTTPAAVPVDPNGIEPGHRLVTWTRTGAMLSAVVLDVEATPGGPLVRVEFEQFPAVRNLRRPDLAGWFPAARFDTEGDA